MRMATAPSKGPAGVEEQGSPDGGVPALPALVASGGPAGRISRGGSGRSPHPSGSSLEVPIDSAGAARLLACGRAPGPVTRAATGHR